MKKIVISGATGAIGMAIIEKCLNEGIQILVLCNPDSSRKERIPKNPLITVVSCGLAEMHDWDYSGEKDWDAFYHLAWLAPIGCGRNDLYTQTKNINYTLDAVHLAHRLGCTTFIGAGSQAEYGRYHGKLSADVPAFPETGYGIAKLCAGQMSRIECHKLGIRHVWPRILSIYGPYDGQQTMIISTIRKLLNGEKPALTQGIQQWDYLYSSDAANALLLLGEKGIDGKVYCVGSGQSFALSDYICKLRDAVDPSLELGFGEIPYDGKQVMHLCADISELQKDTGFLPQVSFEEGIRKTIYWAKKTEDQKNEKN